MDMTPTYKLNSAEFPSLYVKREDMIPYSFGGNKARKAIDFFQDIDKLAIFHPCSLLSPLFNTNLGSSFNSFILLAV